MMIAKMRPIKFVYATSIRIWNIFWDFTRGLLYSPAFKKVGRDIYIAKNVSFGGIYNIEIGHHVSINQGCNLYGDFGIKIGNYVRLSPYVQLYSANYILKKGQNYGENGKKGKEIVIGNNVWIGSGSVVLPGVKIGDNSVIGALSLVNKDIPSEEIWGGAPAKFIRKIL